MALVQPRPDSASNQLLCSGPDTEEIARALLQVNIRSLTVMDRQLCFSLLLELVQVSFHETIYILPHRRESVHCCHSVGGSWHRLHI
jgi:hypothetical protein